MNHLAHGKLARSTCRSYDKKDFKSNNDEREEDEGGEQHQFDEQYSENSVMNKYDELVGIEFVNTLFVV